MQVRSLLTKPGTSRSQVSLHVDPGWVPLACPQVFASIGRTVFRDVGPTGVCFRIAMKVR